MKPETRFWKWLSPRLPAGHYTRIESEVSEGFPDVHGTPRNCHSLALELKYANGPKYAPLKGKIRQSQIFWHQDEWAAGGLSWVVAEFPKHGSIVLFLPVDLIETFGERTFPELEAIADLKIAKRIRPEVAREKIREFFRKHAGK